MEVIKLLRNYPQIKIKMDDAIMFLAKSENARKYNGHNKK